MKKAISLILAFSFLLALTVPAAAADSAVGTTLRLTETKGTVTVKTAAGESKSVVKSMRLYSGYTVGTGASSSAYIGLDDTKAVQLDSSGMVEIKKQGKKLEVSLTSGQLYFNVTEPLKTDESLNIRTATMVTGIRGSFGWVTPKEMGLMHGHVTLTCTNPETGASRVTEVYSGEKVTFETATQVTAADPTLLEIDFVKEEITNADVPAIVVEEIKKDETLQAQLTEHAEAVLAENPEATVIDVPTLIGSLETKQAEEKAAEEAAQAQVEEAVAAQETAIAEEAAAEQASGTTGGTAQDYVFETPAASTGDGGSDYTPSAPTTYTVTFDTGSGSAVTPQTVLSGSTVTRPADPTYDGFSFVNWYTDSTYATVFDFTSDIMENTTIYAGWGYTVTLYTDSTKTTVYDTQKVLTGGKAARPASNPSKTDAIFDNWYIGGTTETVFDFTTSITADTDIYAKWTASSLSGSVNSDVTWALTENGTLSGGGTAYQLSFALASGSTSGFISDYDDASTRPWVDYAASINDVSIGAGITIIGRSACSGFTALTSVTIPGGVRALSINAFSGCSSLSSVTIRGDLRGNGNGVGDFAFYGCASNLNVEFTNSAGLALLGRNKSSGTAHLAIGNSAFDAGTTLKVGDNTVTAVRGTVGSFDATSSTVALGDGTTYSYSYSSVCADRIDTTGDVQLYVQSTGTANEIVNYYNGY